MRKEVRLIPYTLQEMRTTIKHRSGRMASKPRLENEISGIQSGSDNHSTTRSVLPLWWDRPQVQWRSFVWALPTETLTTKYSYFLACAAYKHAMINACLHLTVLFEHRFYQYLDIGVRSVAEICAECVCARACVCVCVCVCIQCVHFKCNIWTFY
jgi:hypothetical protein